MSDEEDPASSIAETMLEVADSLRLILETVDGHRAELTARGYSPTAAEVGAMEVHSALIRSAFGIKA